MILEVIGYKWETQEEANQAEQLAKEFYGLPKTPESKTTEAFKAVQDAEGFWYHIGEIKPLGETQTFTINI